MNSFSDKQIRYKHALILFGGLQGIEAALENDENLTVDDPALLFDHYINALPTQGTRTIRTEEAILVTLSALQSKMDQINPVKKFELSESIAQSSDNVFLPKFDSNIETKPKEMEQVMDMDRFD